jgi:signal transduction histidine kinase
MAESAILAANPYHFLTGSSKFLNNFTLKMESDRVHLRVQDTGEGIAPDDLPHIFNRFYRGNAARVQVESESGLGLAIARSLVEAHGGAIHVESTPGNGSTFTVTLPAAG